MRRRDVMRLALLAGMVALVPPPGRAATVDTTRLVVIGGTLTEIVFALGKGETVVGVDQTSVWPDKVKALPQVGYYKKVSAEGVLALAPTAVLTYADAEPAAALAQLERAGVTVIRFERSPPLKALMDNIAAIGRLFGVEAEAARLGQGLQGELDQVRQATAALPSKPRVLFLLNYDPSQMVVAGRGTIADLLIGTAGGVNAVDGLSGFKPLNAEMVGVAAPDIVLTVDDRWDGLGGAAGMKRLPGVADTPAGRNERFAALPGPLMLGLGPRMGEAVRRLARLFHGDQVISHGR